MRNPADAFDVLLGLTRALTEQDLELDAALRTVTDAARRLFSGTHASLRVVDETGDELRSGARVGVGEGEQPPKFERGEGVVGWVIEHGQVARIDHVADDPRFIHFKDQRYVIASLLAIPLWSAGKVVGCLTITSDQASHFDDSDELIGRLLANCAVPPLERARLQQIAMTDPQTRALTHGYLLPRLEGELELAKEKGYALSMLLMDLDHFKRVNDTHGHAAGDEVLVAFGELVKRQVRKEDVFVRRGGEEFVVLMPACRAPIAFAVAERIRETLADTPIVVSSGAEIRQEVSIGVAEWNQAEDAKALEGRADAAMYEAKRTGRNRTCVSK
ncbi:MAG: sensor domain-containing diguanylate cyclase [Myxococcota bacterium]